ncbi:putative phosphothreonine lyase domain-containing protein [Natronorubrum sp. DTA28]|uniref:putative phosphothreonine lyase domain-containing protein n=1 Tax=Natronorubrum sp. DTA28 TaxID=3447019 RepID=UPI003F829CE8
MDIERDPTEITDDGRYWLRAQRVTGYPRIARDAYFPTHDVIRPAAVSATDLPQTDDDAVRRLDEDALETRFTSGKWQVTAEVETIVDLWPRIVNDVSAGVIWDAKVMTATGMAELPYDEYMIVVYTPNYFDTDDVFRVREHLRETYDCSSPLRYKPDIYSKKGIVAETASEWGLERPARFRA